jgi:hypothetical protein
MEYFMPVHLPATLSKFPVLLVWRLPILQFLWLGMTSLIFPAYLEITGIWVRSSANKGPANYLLTGPMIVPSTSCLVHSS